VNPATISAEPVEPVAVESAAVAQEPAEAAGEAGAEQGDRGGRRRRSRRRRNRGRGFPDSKYSSDEQAAGEESAGGDDEAEAVAGSEEPEAEAEAPEEVFVLPGESLAKYRRQAEAAPKAQAIVEPEAEEAGADAEAEVDEAEDAADATFALTGETEEEVAEEILERVEEAEAAPEASIEIVATSDDEIEEESAAEEAAAGAEMADEVPAEVSEESAGEEGPEPARTPQSLTATLRAQGGRLGHRVSRRMRRRGRGRDRQDEQAGVENTEATPLTPETEEVQAAAPERRERSERGDRGERSERGERGDRGDRGEDRERRERPPLPSISELLKEGQEIIVQIAKEPLGQKGARITSHIALPGRYVVYMPTVEHLGVSRKVSTDEERQRLKRILQKHREGVPGGYIMRTAGEGRTEDEIAADMKYLAHLWSEIKQKADKRRAPVLLHHDVEIVERILRDQFTDGFKAVWVDNEDMYEQILHTMERFAPSLLSRVKLYTRPEPIFDAFGITQELEKALRPKVWLKSGGYIVINQTEALVAIDVNTGKYVGKSNRLEDTIVKTNLEAVKEIARQMRLRDLGGIIVVDFIDMDERKNRQKVMQALEEAMRTDKAPYKILQFNDFGLVAITRKRVKQSLERALCSPCPYCEGSAYVKSVDTVIGEILAQAQKYAKVVDTKDCVLRVSPEVAKEMKSVENKYLEELEEVLGRPVLVTSDPDLHQEKFDLT
jgi:ribonuclease G